MQASSWGIWGNPISYIVFCHKIEEEKICSCGSGENKAVFENPHGKSFISSQPANCILYTTLNKSFLPLSLKLTATSSAFQVIQDLVVVSMVGDTVNFLYWWLVSEPMAHQIPPSAPDKEVLVTPAPISLSCLFILIPLNYSWARAVLFLSALVIYWSCQEDWSGGWYYIGCFKTC